MGEQSRHVQRSNQPTTLSTDRQGLNRLTEVAEGTVLLLFLAFVAILRERIGARRGRKAALAYHEEIARPFDELFISVGGLQ